MTDPVLLGLDPSTAIFGWAAITFPGKRPIDFGAFDFRKARRNYEHLGVGGSMGAATLELFEYLWSRWEVVPFIYVETMYQGVNSNTTIVLAQCSGVAQAYAHLYWPQSVVEPIRPLEWRHEIGLKNTSSKQDVKEKMIDSGWPSNAQGQDPYDAAAIAYAGWSVEHSDPENPQASAKVKRKHKMAHRRKRAQRTRFSGT